MSRTNHAKAEHEARTAREAKQYAQKIADRDDRREREQCLREFNRLTDWLAVELPLAVATFA